MKIAFFSDTYPPEINGVATATKTLFDAFDVQDCNDHYKIK